MALLEDLRKGLVAEEYRVLIDKYDLTEGDPWRQTLNTWIGGCDVAVLVLTEKALESKYVQYEANILKFRETSVPEHKCMVIPIFVDPVDAARVSATPAFEPSKITETQGITAKDLSDEQERARIVAALKTKLAGYVPKASPLEEQEIFLQDLLKRNVPEIKVQRALDKLDVDYLEGWKWDVDDFRRLALALLSGGLNEKTVSVIRDFRAKIKDRRELQALFDVIATSWIDLRTTCCLAKIALGQEERLVALDAGEDIVAKLYVLRAANRDPLDTWSVAVVVSPPGENPAVERLSQDIESSLKQAIGLEPDANWEELKDSLDYEENDDCGVFVVIPAGGLTRKVLEQLRAKFQTVTFFLLAGNTQLGLAALESEKIPLLAPRLKEKFPKEDFVTIYNEHRENSIVRYLRKQEGQEDER